MLFNSFEFLFLYLPIVILIFYGLSKLKYYNVATGFLVIASFFFYAYWDISYLPLLIFSIIFNFLVGKIIERTRIKSVLIFGIIINIILLGYYKYTNFFIDSINELLGSSLLVTKIILPLGISFFTFTQIKYLIDAYKGETKGYNILNYSLFVTFFPHLIAGPILDHKKIIPQFKNQKSFIFSHENFAIGITFFTLGLFKKVIIADSLIRWVTPAFNCPSALTFTDAWSGALAYSMQLYYDFSGYSEMALGLGYMLNIELPINFDSPYISTSIIEFWRRWHITLSEFLKQYIYIPLGGSKKGFPRKIINLLITMLLGGLWHGAGWTYVIWGLLHGIYLSINHIWRKLHIQLPKLLGWIITFISVVIAWVFFRASTIMDAVQIIKSMFNLSTFTLRIRIVALILLIIVTVISPNANQITKKGYDWKLAFLVSALLGYSIINLNKVTEFIYFQF